MRSKYLLLAAAIVMGNAAHAQTSSTTVAPAPDNATSTAVSGVPAANDQSGLKPELKYLGYMHGAGLDFSGAHQAGINSDKQMNYEQRLKVLGATSKNFDFGMEARVNTNFGNGDTMNATSGNWRLLANFKNVLKDDIFNLTLSPRVYLPTSNAARNSKTTPSPDMIAILDVAPKNTRFNFELGAEYIQLFHSQGALGSDYLQADTTILAPWLEVDYQVSEKVLGMVAYWPSWASQAHAGAPLTDNFNQDGGNEIDLGAYYEFSKGWQINPFVATEMSGIGQNGNGIGKNMQLNFLIIGTIL